MMRQILNNKTDYNCQVWHICEQDRDLSEIAILAKRENCIAIGGRLTFFMTRLNTVKCFLFIVYFINVFMLLISSMNCSFIVHTNVICLNERHK